MWETPRQACDQERRGGVALELGTSQLGSTTASELIPPLQVGMSRGDRGRGVPNPTSLSSPTGPEKRLLEAIADDRRMVKCSMWMREENGREKGEERIKFFPAELLCGGLVSEKLVGSPLLEFEGDTDTLHRFVLNPCPSSMFFSRHGSLYLSKRFLFLAPPCFVQKNPHINAMKHPGCDSLSVFSLPRITPQLRTQHPSPPHTELLEKRQ